MNTWHVRAAALAAAVITTLAGCSSAPAGAGLTALSGPSGQNVTVAAIPSADLAGLYVAQNDGLFARQGLHVTIKTIASTKAVIASQLNGQVDIGAGSYVGYVAAQAAGARFRILAEASTLRPHTRVLLTTAGSRITTPGDLAGKKIGLNGTGSIGTLLISMLLAENGISPAKVHFVTDKQGFPDMAGQLQRGQWDAAFLAEPYASEAGEDYGPVELSDLDQGRGRRSPRTTPAPPGRPWASPTTCRPR
jgi:NitT/TauT family transport system substrate-binding protein